MGNTGTVTLPHLTGWTCVQCGSWVPNGTQHICHWPHPPIPQPDGWSGTVTLQPVDNSGAILTELREIKGVLKEILREIKHQKETIEAT